MTRTKYGDSGCKDKVWEKGIIVPGKNKDIWRKDYEGNNIKYKEYNTTTKYSWNIHHKKDKVLDGSDDIINLVPRREKSNKSDGAKLGNILKK